MSKPLDNYPFLRKFLDKHRLALQNKSKDVRFTIEELNDVVMDITAISLSVSEKVQDNTELKSLMQNLLTEIKSLSSDSAADGGRF